jgi:hypothetical protein
VCVCTVNVETLETAYLNSVSFPTKVGKLEFETFSKLSMCHVNLSSSVKRCLSAVHCLHPVLCRPCPPTAQFIHNSAKLTSQPAVTPPLPCCRTVGNSYRLLTVPHFMSARYVSQSDKRKYKLPKANLFLFSSFVLFHRYPVC